jgi:hypothetical protein
MTKPNLTDITIILDESSSMAPDRERTLNAINEFIKGQQVVEGECNLSLYTFSAPSQLFSGREFVQHDSWLKCVWDGINIKEISELSRDSFNPSGMTALYDAVSIVTDKVGLRLRNMPEYLRPGKVIIAIMTDGGENASKTTNLSRLREKIQNQENQWNWSYLFLGASFDTKEVTSNFGLSLDRSYNFNKCDMVKSYKGLSRALTDYRLSSNSKLPSDFSEKIAAYSASESN